MNMDSTINKLLEGVAEELSITDSQHGAIERAYNSVADWLNKNDSYLNGYKVQIFPQGSMKLGTVVKPLQEDDYDVDLVCLLTQNSQNLSASDVKHLVGNRLKEHEKYSKMLKKPEGNRCWKLVYSDDLNFHMDILPSVPFTSESLNQNSELNLVHGAPIWATHKQSDNKYDFIPTNPRGYAEWFKGMMQDYQKILFERGNIEKLPEYPNKTPLQMTVQLLKRHRDVMYENDKEDIAPISIIITTLAARAYRSEMELYSALYNIVNSMDKFIEDVNGTSYVRNPVMNKENFAEKWITNPKKKKAFFDWLMRIRKDLEELSKLKGLDLVSKKMKEMFGQKVVDRTFNKYGAESKELRAEGKLGVSKQTTNISAGGDVKIQPHSFHSK